VDVITMLKPFAKGTLVADGSEQVVMEISEAARVSGYISLANMEVGDTVVIRQYVKLLNGEYRRYAAEAYTGVQENPIVYITPKELASAIKLTLQQTSGTYKTFKYLFIKEAEAPKSIAQYLERQNGLFL
jgi:hypothetical protein